MDKLLQCLLLVIVSPAHMQDTPVLWFNSHPLQQSFMHGKRLDRDIQDFRLQGIQQDKMIGVEIDPHSMFFNIVRQFLESRL
ncbi:Uncharacterised protein [Mycobacteroides abscessus subsp. abscessus]|nr:Uncharacterised protein [Mycobacteroides abscessus subsp. abscessus]